VRSGRTFSLSTRRKLAGSSADRQTRQYQASLTRARPQGHPLCSVLPKTLSEHRAEGMTDVERGVLLRPAVVFGSIDFFACTRPARYQPL
jgi:hypothetical protein